MVIHTFGDSHSNAGWLQIPNINIHYLGPKLCYSIGRDGINIKDGYNVNNNDIVIFCFGEIDCRCQVNKRITESVNYKQIIDNIVDNYFIKIKNAVDNFDYLQTVIYNVVPPVEKDKNVVPPVEKDKNVENPDYPYLGTDEERKSYVIYFNERLHQKCIEHKFIYFNVYDKYIDCNGYLTKELSDDNVHIKDSIYMVEFIEKYLMT